MASKIVYKDFAVGADTDAAFSASDKTPFSNLNLGIGEQSGKYYTLEKNRWLLNGGYVNRGANQVAFWSEEMSGSNCSFATPITITALFDNQYSSVGVTLQFDTVTGEYCSEVDVKWYQGSTLKANGTFYPDKAVYFCDKQATSWNKIVITLKKTSLPNRYAKMEKIMFGIWREFSDDELRSAIVTNESNLISCELPDSTLEFELNSKTDVNFMFQLKQPIEVYNNDSLIGVYYIDSSRRMASRIYDISAKDAIGVLSEQQFSGGSYISGISAKTLVSNIVDGAFTVVYESGLSDATLYGVLLAQDKRSALQQVLFAWGVFAATDGGNTIKIGYPKTNSVTVSESRTFDGVSVEQQPIVTGVKVVAHTYASSTSGNVQIGNSRYTDTETVYTVTNPNVTANDKQNIKEVRDATLVSTHNGQTVAQRVYDYYSKRSVYNGSIILDGEMIGDKLTQPTMWETSVTGNVERMRIVLSGMTVANVMSVGAEA